MSKVLLTGGYGFLGNKVWNKLLQDEGYDPVRFRSRECDLTCKEQAFSVIEKEKPDIVIHLAARVGGIGANSQNPGKFFYENMSMGLNIIEASRVFGVKKFMQIGTVCSYPKYCSIPFKEKDLWEGYPEETNAPYGVAKKCLYTMLESYYLQYGMNSMVLVPCNLYGPGDNFDNNSSHVIPALIKKILAAKKNKDNVNCWGDGSATREFLYVDDCAEIIVECLNKIENYGVYNIGSGFNREISIKNLVNIICGIVEYNGNINWQEYKPNGQPRRLVDNSKITDIISFKNYTELEKGLKETIEWYVSR